MSKIETALRLAKANKAAHRYYSEDDKQSNVQQQERELGEDKSKSTLPIIVRLEPYTRYELDTELLARNRVITDEHAEVALTSYKMLRTRILQKMNTYNWRSLAVTSPHDGAGKSLTAINLAIAMASHGAHDVYLLDLDLRHPEIGQRLGLPEFDLDLGEYLSGRVPISRVCCDVGIDHLLVLPSSQHQMNSSELITTQLMQGLLKTILATVSDPIVIIDLPAILAADDALALAPWVDGYLLVVSESHTRRDDVTRSLEMLRDSNVLGIVLNKSSEK